MGAVNLPETQEMPKSATYGVIVVHEPEKIQILLEETRRTILTVLGNGIEEEGGEKRFSMSVPEITLQMNALFPTTKGKPRFKQTAIYHHIEILKENGFIELVETGSIKSGSRSPTSYYRRTAPVFVVSNVLEAAGEFSQYEDTIMRRLKERTARIAKAFGMNLSKEEMREFEVLLNNFREASDEVNQALAELVSDLDPNDALGSYRLIWRIWACTSPDMSIVSSKIKNYVLTHMPDATGKKTR